jgi:FADH2 O2-dependent halogenase
MRGVRARHGGAPRERHMIERTVDVAVVGSGFSGTILAMILRRLGRSVILLERGRHPRFAIGESSTPLASLLLEEMARRYDLPSLLPFTKYGTWTREHPDVACGLKRGFTFLRHDTGAPFATDARHRHQLLVAASPVDEIGDVHWYRPDFDHFLVREAAATGVEYMDACALDAVERRGGVTRLAGHRRRQEAPGAGDAITVDARLVVDATGPRGFLHRALGLGERTLPGLPPTQALYTHFTGVRRIADVVPGAFAGAPPYPPDAAALHHIVDGGWIWVLRFDNGITSAGVAATDALAADLRLADGAGAWTRLLARYPTIAAQFAGATPTREFTWAPRLSFASAAVAGDGWLQLPSAAGIVDPLLSTGFPLTLLGVQRVAAAIAGAWESPAFGARLADYATRTAAELDTTARLVGALYGAFGDWDRFVALTQLYFAAASYTESCRRLGRPELAGDAFLLAAHPAFGPAFDRCLAMAERRDAAATPALVAAVREAIAPVNVAGLLDPDRANWYACVADDLVAAAPKLQSSEREVTLMLERCGFTPSRPAGGGGTARAARRS